MILLSISVLEPSQQKQNEGNKANDLHFMDKSRSLWRVTLLSYELGLFKAYRKLKFLLFYMNLDYTFKEAKYEVECVHRGNGGFRCYLSSSFS
jgi:hypothetical protein